MVFEAKWNGEVIAKAEKVEQVEGNAYFAPENVNQKFLTPSSHTSVCGWKGDCSYYNVVVNGKTNENAAWVYKNPKPAAQNIKGFIAFWKGVEVVNH